LGQEEAEELRLELEAIAEIIVFLLVSLLPAVAAAAVFQTLLDMMVGLAAAAV
jgi:hypothetical protein